MTFADLAKKVQKFTLDNSPLLLTAVGVTGTVSTAYLAGRGAFKAADILREYEQRPQGYIKREHETAPDFKKKVNLTWKCYIPAVASGVATITAIVGANKIGTSRTAALAAAYSLSQTAVEEYKAKVVEKLGEKKAAAVQSELAQARVDANPIGNREIIMAGNGDVDCYDQYSGRYFKSSVEEIKAAQNHVNYLVNNQLYASLNEFYDFLGLSRIDAGEEVGWTSDKLMELAISATLSDKGEPCVAIDFHVKPVRDYFRLSR